MGQTFSLEGPPGGRVELAPSIERRSVRIQAQWSSRYPHGIENSVIEIHKVGGGRAHDKSKSAKVGPGTDGTVILNVDLYGQLTPGNDYYLKWKVEDDFGTGRLLAESASFELSAKRADEEVEITCVRSVEERNAEGFRTAIDVDADGDADDDIFSMGEDGGGGGAGGGGAAMVPAVVDTVTLVIEFVSGGAVDRAARLLWVNDADEERAYLDIQERATIRQETFPGHRWLVRGQSSNNVLLRMTANHNAEQRFRIDGDAADEVRNALCDAPNIDPAAGEFQAEDVPAGTWVAVSGQARFERVARPAGSRRIEWRELDSAGVETGRLHQVEVHVQTRWLWWLSAAWRRVQSASRGHESLILPLLSVAAAYHVDFALPHWISQATGGRIQLNTLIVLVFLVGAAVAAAFPLQESYIVLFNAATRTEVRLGDHQGHAREPSNRPGHAAAWLPVCEGGFHVLPRELRALRGRQQHHYVVLTVIGVLLARAAVTMP